MRAEEIGGWWMRKKALKVKSGAITINFKELGTDK